ncbi:MAG: ABC transporter permease [Firmicutes bacterium]|nr:ABC transporter permease [Bacillota bacterium]
MNGDLASPLVGAVRSRKRGFLTVFGPRLAALGGAVLLWEILGRLKISVIIPTVSGAVKAWFDLILSGKLGPHIVVSLGYFAAGFFLAVFVGILLGALMARYQLIEDALDFWINLGMSAPMLAFIPLLIILFGLGDATRVAVTFLFAFWVIVVNTFTGIRYLDPALVEMAVSFGASEGQLFWKIRLLGALPLIMAGIRMGVGRAIKGMVNGEMLITVVGLGAMVMHYGNTFNGEYLFAIIATITVVALVFTSLIRFGHRRLAPWDK